jgi:hypothetical protein
MIRLLDEKLLVSQLLMKFPSPPPYRIRRIIAVFTRARHWITPDPDE